MMLKSLAKQHLKGFQLLPLGSCRAILRRTFLLLLSVSFWLTGCGQQGSTNNHYYGNENSPTGKQNSMNGGGGASGDGGGGQGVLCDMTVADPQLKGRLLVRDVYEAISEKNRKMISVPGAAGSEEVSPEALEALARSLKNYFGPASSSLGFTTADFWKKLTARISFLEDDHELLHTQDAYSAIHLQAGCKTVQIAFWDESPGTESEERLYVSRKLWKSLDQLNKIALLAHEVFYAQARRAQYKNSDAVRNKVGQLLSVDGLEPLFSQWVPSRDRNAPEHIPAETTGFKVCEGVSEEDPTSKIQIFQYKGKDQKQHIAIPILASHTINSAWLQGKSFYFDPTSNPTLAAVTDLLLYQTEFHGTPAYFRLQNDLQFDRWYSSSGLLAKYSDETAGRFFDRIPYNEKVMSYPVAWNGHLMSSPTPIKLSLVNTMADWARSTERTPRSREEQIVQLNQLLVQDLVACGVESPSAEEAIATLHQEIAKGLATGKHPRTFPLWTQTLSKLSQSQKEDLNSSKSPICNFKTNQRLQRTLPSYLFSLNLKTDLRAEGTDALGDAYYTPRREQEIPLGKIKVSQGSQSLEFNLICQDYATLYVDALTKKNSETKSASVSARQIKNMLPETFPDTVEGANNIGSFISLLQMNDAKNKSHYSQFIELALRKNEGPRAARPEQVQALISDLAKESSLTVLTCDQNVKDDYDGSGVKYRDTNCVVLKMNNLGRSYTVYFMYDMESPLDSQVPRLDFVQITPTVP